MSIINTNFGFIFVHVPKTAGTTITSLLSQFSSPFDIEVGGSAFGEEVQAAYKRRYGLSKHSPASQIKAIVGETAWKKMFSFGVVRDPLQRLASAYRFLRSWDSPSNNFLDIARSFPTFEAFVDSEVWIERQGPDQLFRPQAFWLASESGSLLVDRVCRVENLYSDLVGVLRDIGIPPGKIPAEIPTLNSTSKPEAAIEPLSDRTIEKIVARYERDYSLLGYPKPLR